MDTVMDRTAKDITVELGWTHDEVKAHWDTTRFTIACRRNTESPWVVCVSADPDGEHHPHEGVKELCFAMDVAQHMVPSVHRWAFSKYDSRQLIEGDDIDVFDDTLSEACDMFWENIRRERTLRLFSTLTMWALFVGFLIGGIVACSFYF